MMKVLNIALLLAASVALSACGEKPQTAAGVKRDTAAFEGPASAFTAPGWKAGDKKSWEQQLRARGQYGSNEYTRVN